MFLTGDPFHHLDCIVSTATGTIPKLGKVNVEMLRELSAKPICSTVGLDVLMHELWDLEV